MARYRWILLVGAWACVGNADKGRLAPRLVPLGPESLLAREPQAHQVFDLPTNDKARAATELVAVRIGEIRRQARFVDVPEVGETVELVTRVPEGIRELELALGDPWSKSTVPENCAVRVTSHWDAGDVREETVLPVRNVPESWSVLRLLGSSSRAPSVLRVTFARTNDCVTLPVLASVSEIIPEAPATLEKRPNVVLIVLDTVRRDRFDCSENSKRLMPRMTQRWCSRGVFFENAFSTSSWTYPAVASIHTGLWPHEHEATRVGGRRTHLTPSATTLAESLRGEGYATFSVVSNPFASWGLSRGFDTFVEIVDRKVSATSPRHAKNIVDKTLAWLTEQRHEPFFISLLFLDAHEPVDAALLGPRPLACEGVEPLPVRWDGLSKLEATRTPEDEARMACRRALYDASLTYMDKEIDRLIDYLVDARLESRTAFVIVSDHGEELWDHVDEERAERTDSTKRWGVDHGHTMYDELVHVPLLIVPPSRGGGSPATLRSSALVSVADVYATVLGFAGAPIPAHSPSRDLTWALEGISNVGRDYVFSESVLYGPDRWSIATPTLHAILTAPDKITVFDRQNDPKEKSPLPEDSPLYREGQAYLRRAVQEAAVPEAPNESVVEALRALGYTE